MREIAIFIEGGGNTRFEQRPMRLAFQQFFETVRKEAMAKRISFRVVMCGGRDHAIKAFMNERRHEPQTTSFLLLDSEEVLTVSKLEHISVRDHVNLNDISSSELHLMVTTMETWICSDTAALEGFYGKGFRADQLPQHINLEVVSKTDVCQALDRATQGSQKGVYRKLQHGALLVERLDPSIVRRRCPACEECFEALKVHIDR